MTRTTLDLDPSVLAQLRLRARTERKSMGALASERLAFALRDEPAAEPAPLRWPSRHLGRPNVDLADKEALRRALEGGGTGPRQGRGGSPSAGERRQTP